MKNIYFATCLIALTFGEISTGADIGGLEAKPHSIPFIVSLVFVSELENVTFCTGSLLNEHWILTTLHCLQLYPQIHVVAGQHSIETFENTTQVRKAFALYQKKLLLRDGLGASGIGLIYVENGFNFSEEVQPVILGDLRQGGEGYVTIHGWGASLSSKVRVYPEYLRSTNISVVDKELCEVAFLNEFNKDTNFCVNGSNRLTGVEQSGGPVMQNGVQVGIVTKMIEGHTKENKLEIFIKVSAYSSWIQEQVFHASTLDLADIPDDENVHSGVKQDGDDLIRVNV